MLGSKFVLLGICGLQSSATFQESDFLSTLGVCNRSCALPIETNCVVVINISFKNICISITERLIPAWKPTTPCCGFGLLLKKKTTFVRTGKIYPICSAKKFLQSAIRPRLDTPIHHCPISEEGRYSRYLRSKVFKFSMRSSNCLERGGIIGELRFEVPKQF